MELFGEEFVLCAVFSDARPIEAAGSSRIPAGRYLGSRRPIYMSRNEEPRQYVTVTLEFENVKRCDSYSHGQLSRLLAISDMKTTMKRVGNHALSRKTIRTIANSLHAGSDGCAPTPNQYFALDISSLISFHLLDSPSRGSFGIGSYVPMTSIGFEFLADL